MKKEVICHCTQGGRSVDKSRWQTNPLISHLLDFLSYPISPVSGSCSEEITKLTKCEYTTVLGLKPLTNDPKEARSNSKRLLLD
jgi:hypothetical protein